ncbi:hypothetical protein [Sphingomonas sp. GM_Shp_1]|jgi:hypothetical protein|uniref:hypothetical protein n=1 Tax=Sphingomonas sp. GM_Shp_1 TaxID=2937381 RepID=UPI00226B33CE|nr:hypothetical protein [Sphingomonas sp. GM_Shp_1]
MSDEALAAYSALYLQLGASDRRKSEFRTRLHADPSLLGVRMAAQDPGGFRAALDNLIPRVQTAFDAARNANDFDGAELIEAFLTRLYFWRIFARDQLIGALDAKGTEEAMAALRTATTRLKETRAAFDQGDHDADTAMTSLDDLADALGLKQ